MKLESPWRATELAPQRERFAQQHQVDWALWQRAGDLGLSCMSIPVEYHCGRRMFAHEAVLFEEQARIADSSWGAGPRSGIAAHYEAARPAHVGMSLSTQNGGSDGGLC